MQWKSDKGFGMAKSHNQKIKILILEQMLNGTGENRVVTMQEILDKLGQFGIRAERKSIYDDMEALRDFGYDIQYKRGRTGGYYLQPGTEKKTQDNPSEHYEDSSLVPENPGEKTSEFRDEEIVGYAKVRGEEISKSGKTMKLLCKKEREKEIREYFGGLGEYRIKASGQLSVSVPQTSGPYFFGWLTAMGSDVHIVKPKKTASAYRDYLKILAKDYKGL